MKNDKTTVIIVDDERIAREILERHLEKFDSFQLVASCKNAIEAFEAVTHHTIDLALLDISMPGISGVSFARNMTRETKVIFTTAHREYAVEGFELEAVDYLLKPVSFERFAKAINRYLDLSRKTRQPDEQPGSSDPTEDTLIVRSDRKMNRIKHAEICYVESFGDYLKIHTKDSITVTRETLSDLASRLPRGKFIRTHRSFLVSIDCITSYTSEYVELGKAQIPVSRNEKDEVMRRLGAER